MSERALTWAQEQVAPNRTAKFVLMRLAAYCDAVGVGWAYVDRLATEIQGEPRTVQRALRALEAVGLIARTGKFYYRNIPYYRLSLELSGTARMVTPVSPLAGSNGDTGVTVENANGDSIGMRMVTPVSPQSIETTSEGKPSSERGRVREPDHFKLAWDGSPVAMRRGRSSQRLARLAWGVEVDQGHDPAALAAAFRRYAGDPSAWGASGQPVAFHRFLTEGRFEGYLPEPGGAVAAAGRTTFAGPPELRAAFVACVGEGPAASYFDQCEWREPRELVAPHSFAAERLRELLRGKAWAAGVVVSVRPERLAQGVE